MADLRPYQTRAVDWGNNALAALPRAGKRPSVVIQGPTACGKSTILSELRPDLVIAPGTDLARQLGSTIPGAEIMTAQLAARRIKDGRPMPRARRVAIDEARLVCAPGYSQIPLHYLAQGAELILTDATPATAGGQGLGAYADALYSAATVKELVRDGFIVPTRVYAHTEQSRTIAALGGSKLPPCVAWWHKFTPGESTIVFAETKVHARAIAQDFETFGVMALVICDDTPAGERVAMIDGLASGQVKVLICAQILRQGIDVPRVSSIILARAVGSLPLFMQAIGRGARLSAATGKTWCTVIDLRGAVHLLGGCGERHTCIHPYTKHEWSLDGLACRVSAEALPPCVQCRKCLAWWPGGGECPVCGVALPPPPLPRAKVADLVEVREAEPEHVKADRLDRFVAAAYTAARLKGKIGREADKSAWSGAHRYKATQGRMPTPGEIMGAIRRAREAYEKGTVRI